MRRITHIYILFPVWQWLLSRSPYMGIFSCGIADADLFLDAWKHRIGTWDQVGDVVTESH